MTYGKSSLSFEPDTNSSSSFVAKRSPTGMLVVSESTSNNKNLGSEASVTKKTNDNTRPRKGETRREKDRFIVFTRVLVKYLEQTNKELHDEVREIIKDCTEKKDRKEPGYESITSALKRRIREVVSDACWKRAELYCERFLKAESSSKGRLLSKSSSRYASETSETETDTLSMTSSMQDPSDWSCSQQSFASHHSSGTFKRRQQKEKFVIVMRVLLKHLESMEPDLFTHVRAVIQDCVYRNQRNEHGFESVTESVRERLEIIVPREYWEQAEHLCENNQRHRAYRHPQTQPIMSFPSRGIKTDDEEHIVTKF